jgi:transcriptional regulator with XRE-family HTH domain
MPQKPKNLCRQLVQHNVRRLRREQNLSQHELSIEAGITRAYLGRLESKGQNLTLDTLCSLADALGVHPQVLFEPVDE